MANEPSTSNVVTLDPKQTEERLRAFQVQNRLKETYEVHKAENPEEVLHREHSAEPATTQTVEMSELPKKPAGVNFQSPVKGDGTKTPRIVQTAHIGSKEAVPATSTTPPVPADSQVEPPETTPGPTVAQITQPMPKCGYCGAKPVQLNSIMAQMASGAPGQPIPIIQFFFCRNCESTLSVQVVGAVPPTIQTAGTPVSRIVKS